MSEYSLKPETIKFNSGVCEHPAYQQANRAFKLLHKYQDQSKALMLIGHYGCGKSFFCKQYTAKHSVKEKPEISVCPVLYVEIQPNTNVGGIIGTLLEKLGDPTPDNDTKRKRGSRLKKLLTKLKVTMVILDEVQELLPSTGLKESSAVLRYLKWFTNEYKIPVVFCGHLDAIAIHHISTQLKSRCHNIIKLEPFSCIDEDRQLAFASYLLGIFELLPRQVHSRYQCMFEDEEGYITLNDNINGLLRFCLATHGIPRYINNLMNYVIEATNDSEIVTKELLAEAWENVIILSSDDDAPKNPFLADMRTVKCELRKRGLYAE